MKTVMILAVAMLLSAANMKAQSEFNLDLMGKIVSVADSSSDGNIWICAMKDYYENCDLMGIKFEPQLFVYYVGHRPILSLFEESFRMGKDIDSIYVAIKTRLRKEGLLK